MLIHIQTQERQGQEEQSVTVGSTSPDDGLCYVVGGNGFFLRKAGPIFTSTISVPDVPLPEIEQTFQYHLPRIPYETFMQAVSFLRDNASRLGSEGIVLIYYSPEEEAYRFVVPEQSVHHLGIQRFISPPTPPGLWKVGDVHSHDHGDTRWFSSHDDRDDAEEDGLRIVVSIDPQDTLSIGVACSFVVNGKRIRLATDAIIEPSPVAGFPSDWRGMVTVIDEGGEAHETCRRRPRRNRRPDRSVRGQVP